jgi:hypothetical protein
VDLLHLLDPFHLRVVEEDLLHQLMFFPHQLQECQEDLEQVVQDRLDPHHILVVVEELDCKFQYILEI